MADILSSVIGGPAMMSFWYHFAILFEALFILTTIDAGTRVGRFMIQDLFGSVYKPLGRTDSWAANLFATGLCVSGWGWFLYQGVVDPLGGINTLWPLFGIANQMLAGIALLLATTVLIKMKRTRYVWVTALPTFWVLLTTLWAGWLKVFSADVKIGFLAHAHKFGAAQAAGQLLPPAKDMGQMQRIVFNDYVDASLALVFMAVVVSMLLFSLLAIRRGLASKAVTTQEAPYLALEAE